MKKYYRVKKDTFLWDEGAILIEQTDVPGYRGIEDIWDKFKNQTEYISNRFIEENPDWFERVYPDTIKGNIYRTKKELADMYKKTFKK